MTKWVTLLLLVLAVLVYGMSQMRPVPEPNSADSPSPNPVSTPNPVTTPEESEPLTLKSPSIPAERTTRAPSFVGSKPGSAGDSPKQPPSRPATDNTPVTGSVKAALLSETSGGPSKTVFQPNKESVYLTITPELIKDEVELVARYRSVVKEEGEFSKDFESSGPPRRRTFRLIPPESGWTSGPYQVVVSPRGSQQVVGLARFEVAKPDQKSSDIYPKPDYLDLVPDLEALEAQSSFTSADKELFLRVDAQQLDSSSVVRTVWSAVEADKLTAGELIATATEPAPGEGKDAVFSFTAPPGGFHTGSYKVDVYFDDELVGSQAFFIQPPSSAK